MIVSHAIYIGFATLALVVTAVVSGGRDIRFLLRLLRDRAPDDRVWRDQVFGAIVGISLCFVGLIGVIRYHMAP